jgi:hypothetical protein
LVAWLLAKYSAQTQALAAAAMRAVFFLGVRKQDVQQVFEKFFHPSTSHTAAFP